MMKKTSLKHSLSSSPVSSILAPRDEALAVLTEMVHRAEQRLIEAGREFEDIAHEMEWRLSDWLRLSAERKRLEQQQSLTRQATPRFNLRARALKASQKEGRKDNWERMVEILDGRLARNTTALEETVRMIQSRNQEGQTLQEEIFALQNRVARIGQTLARMDRPAFTEVDMESALVSALTRFSLPQPDRDLSADPATLLAAACVVEHVPDGRAGGRA